MIKYIVKKIDFYQKKYEIEDSQKQDEIVYKYILKFKPEILILDQNELSKINSFDTDIFIQKHNDLDCISVTYYEILYKIDNENIFNEILKLNEDYFEALKQIDIDNILDVKDQNELDNILLYNYSIVNFNVLEEVNNIKDLLN